MTDKPFFDQVHEVQAIVDQANEQTEEDDMSDELLSTEVLAYIDALRADFKAALEVQRALQRHRIEALVGRIDALEGVDSFTQAEFNVFNQAVNKVLAGKADLVDGKIPMVQLPALALTNVSVVDDSAAMDALDGPDEGDVAVVRANVNGVRATYIYDGSAWEPLSSPADVTEAELAAGVQAGLAVVMDRIEDEAAARVATAEALSARIDGLVNPETSS